MAYKVVKIELIECRLWLQQQNIGQLYEPYNIFTLSLVALAAVHFKMAVILFWLFIVVAFVLEG